jgi:hypothetical protein
MPDIGEQGFVSRDPSAYKSTIIGTAVGTTTISKYPGFLKSIVITRRAASAVFVLYNSDGTSTSVLGTIALGTQTFSDPPPPYELNLVFNKLTIANTTADAGAIALWNTG